MSSAKTAVSPVWFVYLVRNASGQLYTGISTDPARRLLEHGAGKRGARALRGKGPLALVFHAEVGSRSQASVLEARIKKLDRARKLQLVGGELDLQCLAGQAAEE